ncbi:MAG: amylo-alpha-1,6-glucosidase, partial [Steroidobacteraceae bacterium]
DLFLVAEQDGHVPREWAGFGLFYRDCCYLGRYELALGGVRPLHLASSWIEGFSAEIELTNASLETASKTPIAMHTLGISRRLIVLGRECTWVDAIMLRNFGREAVRFPLTLAFSAGFESIFVVRGARQGRRGVLQRPICEGATVTFGKLGADDVQRSLEVTFSRTPSVAPQTSEDTVASFDIVLEARESCELRIAMRVRQIEKPARAQAAPRALPSREALDRYQEHTSQHWLDGLVRVESDAAALERVVRRSLSDLRLLRLERDGLRFAAAGVPWFVGLFGRDTLIPCLQCLAFDAEMAKQTAQLLARYQGQRCDARRFEQPGKILHELRVGEMAHLGEIAQTPSYASVDSTLLFLILVARYASWTGPLGLFEALEPAIAKALTWIAECGDLSGRGYVEYDGKTEQGSPINQGWKDSGEAVVRKDGSFPEPPIALAEVQGYAYLAKRALAGLYRSLGKSTIAARLEGEAAALRARFNRDFWMPAEGCYCMGLERGGRQICTLTSNAGQVLF